MSEKKKISKEQREIQKALDRFPRIVREKKERYRKRQAFLKRTFGDLVKLVAADERRIARLAKKKNN